MIRFHYCRFGFRLMIGIRSAREMLMQPARNTTLGYVRTTPTTWPQRKWVFGMRQVFGYVIDLVLPTSAGSYNTAYNFTIRCRLKKSTGWSCTPALLLCINRRRQVAAFGHTRDPRTQAFSQLRPTNAGIIHTQTHDRRNR